MGKGLSHEDRNMSGINHRPRMRRTQSTVHSPQHSSHVIIIGGGIAGLSTAYALQEQARLARMPLACTLIEAQKRLGDVVIRAKQGYYARPQK